MTGELAKLLGRLVSIEMASPLLQLRARPLFDDLKDGLTAANVEDDDEKPIEPEGRQFTNYEWVDTRLEKSDEAKKAAGYVKSHLGTNPSQATKEQRASPDQDGCVGLRVRRDPCCHRKSGTFTIQATIAGAYAPADEIVETSSTAREAYGNWKCCEASQKVVGGKTHWLDVADNKALHYRYAIGTKNRTVNKWLQKKANWVIEQGHTYAGMLWVPRDELNTEEQDASRSTQDR